MPEVLQKQPCEAAFQSSEADLWPKQENCTQRGGLHLPQHYVFASELSGRRVTREG